MRRKDREMPSEFARMVVDKCEWAVISMIDSGGKPYCVPISIALENNTIYFHSAKDGYKNDCLLDNGNVCISCVGDTCRLPSEFTTEYESAIIRGKAYLVDSDAEQIRALRLLCQRHTPQNMQMFESEINRSLARTAVWKVEIQSITGKRKKYGSDGKELKFGKMEELI